MGQLTNHNLARGQRLRQSTQQDGVAIVEFLISVPFLLLLFAAVAEFGIIFYTQTTLNSAVQDGTRYIASKSIYGQDIPYPEIRPQFEADVKNLVVYGNIKGNGTPLVAGLNATMVTVDCVNGSTVTPEGGKLCKSDITVPSMAPYFVRVQYPYVPALGNMLKNLTGIDMSISLKASATHIGF